MGNVRAEMAEDKVKELESEIEDAQNALYKMSEIACEVLDSLLELDDSVFCLLDLNAVLRTNRVRPESVFDHIALEKWAEKNGYVRAENE